MRQRLAWVFVALTVMLVIGFLVPLGLSLRSQAELRSLAGAQSDARVGRGWCERHVGQRGYHGTRRYRRCRA